MKITHAKASTNILTFVAEGRLTQAQWRGTSNDGRKIACLLGAISPKVNKASDCNGDLMPMWLAELTPELFDGIPKDQIYPVARRYGELVAQWGVLPEAAWRRVLTRLRVRLIDDAVGSARPFAEERPYWPAVTAACMQSKAAIEAGDQVAAWAAARAAAAATRGAWGVAAWAAEAAWAAWAAEAAGAAGGAGAAWGEAAWAAARAAAAETAEGARAAWAAEAVWAARAAEVARAAEAAGAAGGARGVARGARAAAEAARAAEVAGAARDAKDARDAAEATRAAGAAAEAAYLRLFTFLLDQIEAEIAEAGR